MAEGGLTCEPFSLSKQGKNLGITTVFDAHEPIQASCYTAWMSARMISNPNGSGN